MTIAVPLKGIPKRILPGRTDGISMTAKADRRGTSNKTPYRRIAKTSMIRMVTEKVI